MRVVPKEVATDHSVFASQTTDDHHATAGGASFSINSQSIGAGLSYNLDVALDRSGCRVLRAVLRGKINVELQGHEGCYVIGTSSSVESASIGIRAYPGGLQSYVGGYSRLHGDGYLSHGETFGNSIVLEDAYINGSDARLTLNYSVPCV